MKSSIRKFSQLRTACLYGIGFVICLLMTFCSTNSDYISGTKIKNTDIATSSNVVKDFSNADSSGQVQILYMGDCSFKLQEPKDMYASSNKNDFPVLVKYLPKNNLNTIGKVGIYSIVKIKEEYGNVSVGEFIIKNVKYAKENGEIVSNGPQITTKSNKQIAVRKYVTEQEYFAEAYIDEPKYIIIVTLSTSDKSDFDLLYSKFEDVVKSYEYLGVKVVETK